MTPAASMSQNDSIDQLPLARIYAEEESFVSPLREYLESHGCRVVLNDESIISETYFLISGSPQFVKDIIALKKSMALRKLGIVITSALSDGQMLSDENFKIVVIDPRYLTDIDVEEIFTFFFSGSEQFLNITRNIHEPKAQFVPAPYDARNSQDLMKNLDPKIISEDHTDSILTETVEHTVLPSEDSKRINQIMSDIFGDNHVHKKKKKTKQSYAIFLQKISSVLTAFVFFVGILLFPISTYFASLGASSFFLLRSANFISKTDIPRATSFLQTGEYWLNQSDFLLTIISLPLSIFGFETSVRGQERLVSLLTDVSKGISQSIDVVSEGKLFIQAAVPNSIRQDEKLPASTLETLRTSISAAHNSLGLAQAELSLLLRDKKFPFSLSFLSTKFSDANAKLNSVRSLLSYAEMGLSVYPKIAGFKSSQSFLVLLQNSNELRPTGGFIGSVGLATFENGTLTDFSIEDVYALDGQLKGHVDPPKPIAELLGNEHWYLRDSNWDPDFGESGQKAIWFYEKETGKHIDGVLAINVPIIVSILKAIGPIQLPDYSERITEENFFGKSLYYTQNNFFPGSTQKRDFLGALARAVMTKIMTDRDIDGMALLKSIMLGIDNRDIVMHVQNPEVQSMIEHFGWGGRVYTNSLCRGLENNRCIDDELLITEANLSVSKVNYYITHDATRVITLNPQGEINERISYVIGNTVNTRDNPNEKGVGGPYQTYVRFILPKDSIVNSVMIDGVAVPTRGSTQKTVPDLPYIENTEGTGILRGIGIALRVPPGEQKELQITYARARKLEFGKGGGYLDILWYKHPGISSMPLKTIIRYPLYWNALNLSADTDESVGTFIAKEAEFEYNTHIERDTNYRIKFIQ